MLCWLFRKKYARRFVLIIIIFLVIVFFIDRYFSDTVSVYTKQKSILFTTILVEDAVRENVVSNLNMEELIILNKDSLGSVSSIQVNTLQANQILADVMKNLYTYIGEIERETDFSTMYVPLGMVFSDTLFANSGPKVNIKLRQVGSVQADIVSTVTEYGINNCLIEVKIVTKVTFVAMIPFQEEEFTVSNEIPILVEIINGETPRYYYEGGGSVVSKVPNDDDDDFISEDDIPDQDLESTE